MIHRFNKHPMKIAFNGISIDVEISGDYVPSSKVLRAAWKLVKQSASNRYKHAAIIYKNNEIISAAYNIKYKTHPNGSGPYQTSHAEVRAIRQGINRRGYISDCKILIIRTNNLGVIKTSKPCKDCRRLIERYGLKTCWTDGNEVYNQPDSPVTKRIFETYKS